jgi:O-acetyl-ADP-ribose deacetylase (regulator of RNase III)
MKRTGRRVRKVEPEGDAAIAAFFVYRQERDCRRVSRETTRFSGRLVATSTFMSYTPFMSHTHGSVVRGGQNEKQLFDLGC